MPKLLIVAAAGALVAGCSGEQAEKKEEAPARLAEGQYQVDWTVAQLRSTDRTTPATNLKLQAKGRTTKCVAADGTIDPALFAEDGDNCTSSNAYVRSGRMSIDMVCKRGNDAGEVRQSVSGTFAKDSLEAEVSTTTYLAGAGDYAMVRTFTGKRIADCPAEAETETKAAGA